MPVVGVLLFTEQIVLVPARESGLTAAPGRTGLSLLCLSALLTSCPKVHPGCTGFPHDQHGPITTSFGVLKSTFFKEKCCLCKLLKKIQKASQESAWPKMSILTLCEVAGPLYLLPFTLTLVSHWGVPSWQTKYAPTTLPGVSDWDSSQPASGIAWAIHSILHENSFLTVCKFEIQNFHDFFYLIFIADLLWSKVIFSEGSSATWRWEKMVEWSLEIKALKLASDPINYIFTIW